jgi:SAM-dependent methyltransferase
MVTIEPGREIHGGESMNWTLSTKPRVTQAQKPTGWLGRFVLRNMNTRHSQVTDWGLSHVRVKHHFTILDIGCGGGRTVGKLAAMATGGKIHGVDYSSASVSVASKANAHWIKLGRAEIQEGSVSQLPFAPTPLILLWRSKRTFGGRIYRPISENCSAS